MITLWRTGRRSDSLRRVNRLRLRGCWDEVIGLLAESAPDSAADAVELAATMVERSAFTMGDWEIAEEAVAQAERLAKGHNQLTGAAALERAYLSYLLTRLGLAELGDEAKSAIRRADEVLPVNSPRRRLLLYRQGLITQYLDDDGEAAAELYRTAQIAAEATGDKLLLSHVFANLAEHVHTEGDIATAAELYADALRLRTECGFVVGLAPVMVALAEVSPPEEARRLRAEARRLYLVFGRVPAGLADEFDN